jgi:hypothetical protein
VRGDLPADRLGEVVPKMPAVGDLDRVGQDAADSLGVGARSVPADDLDAGMGAQPGLQRVGAAVGQDIDSAAGLRVDQDRGVALPAAQREVVHAEHPRDLEDRQGQTQQAAQRGVPRQSHRQGGQDPRAGAAG